MGTERFRVTEWLAETPFPRARVTLITEPEVGADALERRAAVAAEFARVLDAARALGAEIPTDIGLADDPVQAGWDAVALAPIGPLDVLAILREDDPVARLDLVVAALADAVEILESRLL